MYSKLMKQFTTVFVISYLARVAIRIITSFQIQGETPAWISMSDSVLSFIVMVCGVGVVLCAIENWMEKRKLS